MLKRVLMLFLTIAIISSIALGVSVLTYSQTVGEETQPKVLYTLPYPGLTPDSPLYFLKAARDRIIDVATRDHMKKAELYLLLSDKRASMALTLAQKGKNKLAVTTFSKGEKYFLQIPPLLKDSKSQGVSPSSEFITKLKLSNAKHQEVGEILLKELTNGETESINNALKITEETRKQLSQW